MGTRGRRDRGALVTASALSPAMVAVLRAIVADAGLVDGRSWRATDALECRGLVQVTATRYGGQPVYELTDTGRAALEAETPAT